MTIAEIIGRFDESLRLVREADGEVGRVNSPASIHLAQSNVALADWAAELPDDLAPHYLSTPETGDTDRLDDATGQGRR